jgi:hypothetical protein
VRIVDPGTPSERFEFLCGSRQHCKIPALWLAENSDEAERLIEPRVNEREVIRFWCSDLNAVVLERTGRNTRCITSGWNSIATESPKPSLKRALQSRSRNQESDDKPMIGLCRSPEPNSNERKSPYATCVRCGSTTAFCEITPHWSSRARESVYQLPGFGRTAIPHWLLDIPLEERKT